MSSRSATCACVMDPVARYSSALVCLISRARCPCPEPRFRSSMSGCISRCLPDLRLRQIRQKCLNARRSDHGLTVNFTGVEPGSGDQAIDGRVRNAEDRLGFARGVQLPLYAIVAETAGSNGHFWPVLLVTSHTSTPQRFCLS